MERPRGTPKERVDLAVDILCTLGPGAPFAAWALSALLPCIPPLLAESAAASRLRTTLLPIRPSASWLPALLRFSLPRQSHRSCSIRRLRYASNGMHCLSARFTATRRSESGAVAPFRDPVPRQHLLELL